MLCWAYNELKGIGERIAQTICFLLCCGPLLIIIGVVTLVSSTTDSRGSQIASYNAAVAAWPALRPNFVARTYSLSVSSVTTPLTFTTSVSDVPSVEAGSGISTSTAAKAAFVASGTSAITSAGPASSPLTLTLTSGNASSSITYYPQFSMTSNPCSSGNSLSQCSSRCSPGSLGTFSTSNPQNAICTTYFVLSAVCLVVDYDAPLGYVIDSAGRGCLPLSSGMQRASVDTRTGRDTRYGQVGPFNYRASSAPSSSFITPSIMVRSRSDPWVVALRVTSGTLNFGLSVEQKQGMGGGLLAGGIVYTILTVCCVGFAIRQFGTSRRSGGTVLSSGVPNGGGVAVFPPQAQPYSISPQGQGQVMYAVPMGYPVGVSPQYPQQPQVQYAPGYPQAQPSYPQAQPSYPQAQQPAGGYPQYPQQQQYAQPQQYPQQPMYAQPQAYAQPQPGYAQGGYVMPPQQAYPQQQAYPPQQQVGYPPKQL